MSSSPAGLVRRLESMAAAMPKAAAAGELRAAELLRAAVAAASGRYIGSRLTRTSAAPLPTGGVLVRMTSRKAHLLDHDTRAHAVLPGAVTGRRGRRQALSTPDGPRASASVRGVRGQLMWERGVAAALPKIAEAVGAEVGAAVARAFGA